MSIGLLAGRVLESSPVHEADEAREYDHMVQRHAWFFTRPFVERVAALDLEHARVLDVGCGPGTIPLALAQARPGWEIVGLDASADMVARAQEHAANAGVAERVRFVPGSALDLPFPAGHFDVVISHFMLHHLEQPAAFFNEAARVVRGGGRVIVKDLRRPPRWQAHVLLAFARWVLRYTPLQLQMYRNSLAAALTLTEARTALRASRLALGAVESFRGHDFIITA